MRALPVGRGAELFEEDLTFLEAGLLAEPEAAGLAGQVGALLSEGQALEQRRKALRRAQLQRQAQAVALDGRLDEQIRALHADALHAVKLDRKDRAFVSLFPENVHETVRYALRRQAQAARGLVGRLGLGLLPQDLVDKHTAAFGALLEQARVALEAQEQVEMDLARLRLELEDWKRDTNVARMHIYSQLLGVAAQRQQRRAWADRFFMPFPGSQGDDASDEPGSES